MFVRGEPRLLFIARIVVILRVLDALAVAGARAGVAGREMDTGVAACVYSLDYLDNSEECVFGGLGRVGGGVVGETSFGVAGSLTGA